MVLFPSSIPILNDSVCVLIFQIVPVGKKYLLRRSYSAAHMQEDQRNRNCRQQQLARVIQVVTRGNQKTIKG